MQIFSNHKWFIKVNIVCLFLNCKDEKCSKRKVFALTTKIWIWITFLKIDLGFKNIPLLLLCWFCIYSSSSDGWRASERDSWKRRGRLSDVVETNDHTVIYTDTMTQRIFWQYSFNIRVIQELKFANSNICFHAVCAIR